MPTPVVYIFNMCCVVGFGTLSRFRAAEAIFLFFICLADFYKTRYHAACKVEFQPFNRSYSQLTFFIFFVKAITNNSTNGTNIDNNDNRHSLSPAFVTAALHARADRRGGLAQCRGRTPGAGSRAARWSCPAAPSPRTASMPWQVRADALFLLRRYGTPQHSILFLHGLDR